MNFFYNFVMRKRDALWKTAEDDDENKDDYERTPDYSCFRR